MCLIAMSAIIHEASAHAALGQMIFWRSALALPPIVAYLALRGQLGLSIRTKRPGKHLIRGILGCIVMALNFTALAYLSVGVATALSYLTPILSMFAAMLLLKERTSLLVVLGVLFGFAGVVIMLFPALAGSEVRDSTIRRDQDGVVAPGGLDDVVRSHGAFSAHSSCLPASGSMSPEHFGQP